MLADPSLHLVPGGMTDIATPATTDPYRPSVIEKRLLRTQILRDQKACGLFRWLDPRHAPHRREAIEGVLDCYAEPASMYEMVRGYRHALGVTWEDAREGAAEGLRLALLNHTALEVSVDGELKYVRNDHISCYRQNNRETVAELRLARELIATALRRASDEGFEMSVEERGVATRITGETAFLTPECFDD